MVGKRRQFSREFKLEAVRRMIEEGRSGRELGRELGVVAETLYRWKKEFLEDQSQTFPGNGTLKDRDKEVEQLRRNNQRLQTENAFLKKVSAYFAKGPK
jgi:transposase